MELAAVVDGVTAVAAAERHALEGPAARVGAEALDHQDGGPVPTAEDVVVDRDAVAAALGLSPAKPWLLPVRDALSFAVFVASFFGRTVLWRDRAFRVEASGRMTVDGDKAL